MSLALSNTLKQQGLYAPQQPTQPRPVQMHVPGGGGPSPLYGRFGGGGAGQGVSVQDQQARGLYGLPTNGGLQMPPQGGLLGEPPSPYSFGEPALGQNAPMPAPQPLDMKQFGGQLQGLGKQIMGSQPQMPAPQAMPVGVRSGAGPVDFTQFGYGRKGVGRIRA